MKCANDGSFLTPRQLYALGMRLAQRYAPGSVTRAMISSLYEKTIPMESVAISRVMFIPEKRSYSNEDCKALSCNCPGFELCPFYKSFDKHRADQQGHPALHEIISGSIRKR